MTLAEIENHREISDRFLLHADEQLARGDLPQASEKAWGAVAHYLKSVAKSRRNWENETHRDLIDVGNDLALETNDPSRAQILFADVRDMHRNFYEDRLSSAEVEEGISAARELISLLKSRTGPQIHPRPSQSRRRRRRRR